MGADVFISYPSREKPAADAICAELETGDLTCWIAPRDIPPGGDWADSIMSGIAGCKLLVVVISKKTGESSHVLREVERAVNRGVPLLPVRIDETIPDGNLGYFLGTSHWFEAQGGQVSEVGDSLRKAARDLIEGTNQVERRPAPGPIPGISRKGFIAGATALLLIAVLGGWAITSNSGNDEAGGTTEAIRLSGDATTLVAGMSESTEELTRAIRQASPTSDVTTEFQEAADEGARIADEAGNGLADGEPGQAGLAESGSYLEVAAGNLEAIADSSAVPGLTEAGAAEDQVARALDSLEQALRELNEDLTAQGSHEAAGSVSATLQQLRENRKELLGPYSALVRSL